MAYRAEIEIAVKGARDLTQFQGKLKATALEVEQLNKFLKAFSQDAEGIPRSIANLNRQLNQASNAFKDVALSTEEARTAAVDYLAATRNLNAGLRERANLLAEVAENERRVKLASAGIRERTQYSGPIGPGGASPIDALVGQSSEVAGRVQRIKDIKDDQRALDEALLNLEKKSAAELNKKVQLQESLVEGTREVLELVAEAQRRQQRTAPAEKLAQSSIKEAAEREARFEARKTFAGQIFDIEKNFSKQLNDADLEFLRKKFIVEEDIQKQLFDRAIALDKEEGKAFDAELKRRTEAKAAAIKKENRIAEQVARRRKEALGSAIIGGAFPLLFGQGIGAAVGGGAGGAAGGLVGGQFGFGLSLVGTALGSSFDALVEGAKELGAALDPLTADISAITKASGLSGTKLEKLILDLEKTGDAAGALSLATEELEKVVGKRGVKALKEFSETAKDVSNDFDVFLTRFKAFVADVFNTLISPRSEAQLKKRGETIAAARESTDPTIQRAVSRLDSASTISERLRIQEVIVSLVEEEEAARRRELELQIASKGEAAAKLREVRSSVAEKRIELEIEQLNADANDETRVLLEKKLAFQRKLTQEQALYNKYARDQITTDILRLEIAKVRVDYEKQLARIDNAAAAANQKAAKAAERKAKAPESKALSLQSDILRERLNLFNVDEQIARVGLDRLSVLEREQDATMVRYLAETQILEAARKDALNKNKVKADEALINELYDDRLLKIRKAAILALSESQAAQDRLRAEQQIADLRAAAGFDPLALAERTQPFASRGIYGAPEGLMDFSTGAELNAIVKQEVALERVLEKYQEIGQAAQLTSELVTTGFQDMLTGTKSAEEVFANFLRNLAEMLIKTAQQMIAQYIAIGIARAFALGQSPAVGTRASDFNLTGFGNLESTGGNVFAGFTPRANGGPVSTGTPYMVGERGPELFVPSNSGTIVPNNALGGDVNVVVNVTETQTDTRGNGARANQVGNALAAAVQAEIIKQKRPGGLLAN